jgi:hypothetical protein
LERIQRITLPPLEWVITTKSSIPFVVMKLWSWPARHPAAPEVHMNCSKSQLITT